MDWPDIEALVVQRLSALVLPVMDPTGTRGLSVGVLTDVLEPGSTWFVRVSIVGGGDDGFTERVVLDVEAFAPTRAGAMDLAAAARRATLALAGTAEPDGTGLVDTVETVQRPTPVPWGVESLYRVQIGRAHV